MCPLYYDLPSVFPSEAVALGKLCEALPAVCWTTRSGDGQLLFMRARLEAGNTLISPDPDYPLILKELATYSHLTLGDDLKSTLTPPTFQFVLDCVDYLKHGETLGDLVWE